MIDRIEFRPNHAVARVVQVVQETGEPYTFNKQGIDKLLSTKEQPFLDALQGFSSPLQERLLEGIQTLTFKADGDVASQRIDAGH